MNTDTAPLVEMLGINKSFGGLRALIDVSVDLFGGEVVGIVGHNGAGKSTLIKILSGALRRDAGEIRVEGEPADINNPRDARALGIETIYQTLALADNLDASANIFLGREILTKARTLNEEAMASEIQGVLNGGQVVDTVQTQNVTKDQVLGMIILGKRIEEETEEDLASLH